MERKEQPNIKWTKEKCLEEASKYSTKGEFLRGCLSAYRKAHREGWLDEICKHMISRVKPNGYWTKERVLAIADNYTTRTDFVNNDPRAYKVACAHGWLKDLYSHIEVKSNSFSKKECMDEALKYDTKEEFMKNSPEQYNWAKNHRFLTEICKHMKRGGSPRVYVFEFEDHHVYIGLSLYPYSRGRQLLKEERSIVYKYIKYSGCNYSFKILTESPINNPSQEEKFWIRKYEQEGWIILNTYCGSHKYTKDDCVLIAKKYSRRIDFKRGDSVIYNYASRYGWLEDICNHMIRASQRHNYWTKERCQEEALKYKTRRDFQKECIGAYSAAYKNGWLADICRHMESPKSHTLYWTKERCQEEALKFETKRCFLQASGGAYSAAKRNGWLADICSHMKQGSKPSGYWTDARILREARKYKSISEFRKNNNSAYIIAWRNGLIDDIKEEKE